jgi:2-polyprenyl-6-methoxyphenol hydroxylase-like FAD-dependent oxidoreductase
MRADLVTALRTAALVAGARIVSGKRWAAGDPRNDDADLIVGADGIWSTIRPALDRSAPAPVYAGLYTVSGIAGRPVLERGLALEPGSFNMIFGRPGAFLYLPAPDGSVWWSAQVAASQPPEAADLKRLANMFGAEPVAASIIRATADAPSLTTNHVLAEVPRQHDARTVLIGDAAHPVGAGQGASMGIEDAVVLARELHRTTDVPSALSAFADLRRARLGKLSKTASRNRDAKTAGPLAARLRDLVMPITFNRFYEKATGWLYDYDPGELPTSDRTGR